MGERTAADVAAIEHIAALLDRMIANATRVAGSQQAAADGSFGTSRSAKYYEAAEFNQVLAARLTEVARLAKKHFHGESDASAEGDEWAVARHWRHSTEYSRAMSELRARALLAEDRAAGWPVSLVRRPAGVWHPVADAHSCANCHGDDPGTCLFNGEKEGS